MTTCAHRALDCTTVVLFAAATGCMALGSVHGQASRALVGVVVVVVLAAVIYLCRFLKAAWRPQRTNPFSVHFLCMCLIVGPASLASVNPRLSLPIGILVLLCFVAFFAFQEAFTARAQGICSTGFLASILAAGSALAILLRLVVHAAGHSGSVLPWFCLAPSDVGGTYLFDHLFSFSLVGALPILVGVGCAEQARRRFLFLACATLVSLGIVLSFSRAAWLAVVCEIVLIVTLDPRARRMALAIGIVAAAVWLLLPGGIDRAKTVVAPEQRTNVTRIEQWRVALDMTAHSPVLGYGPGTFGDAYREFNRSRGRGGAACPHNLFIHLAVEFGIPALLVFFAGMYHVFDALRPRKTPGREGGGDCRAYGLRVGALASLAGFLVFGFFHL